MENIDKIDRNKYSKVVNKDGSILYTPVITPKVGEVWQDGNNIVIIGEIYDNDPEYTNWNLRTNNTYYNILSDNTYKLADSVEEYYRNLLDTENDIAYL